MDKTRLFIKTLEDIEGRLASHDEYEILMIAGLLRKLLLDSNPLMNQANQEKKIKITFRINDRGIPQTPPIPTFWSIEDGLDPETSVAHLCNPKEVNKDSLLNTPIILFNGNTITIKDLIQHMAHVEGAIHPGTPKSDEEKILKELGQTFGIGGLPAGIRLLKAISRVVLKGLQTLRLEISN